MDMGSRFRSKGKWIFICQLREHRKVTLQEKPKIFGVTILPAYIRPTAGQGLFPYKKGSNIELAAGWPS